MKIGITIILCSFIYTLLVYIVYNSKKKLDNVENKIYKILINLNLIGLVLELLCCLFLPLRNESAILGITNAIVNRVFAIYMATWLLLFTYYVINISFNNINLIKKINKLYLFIYFIIVCLISFLPINYYYDGIYCYSYGPATNLILVIAIICILISLYCVFKNHLNIKQKKYYPLYTLIIMLIIMAIIRSINPGIILINSAFAFISIVMFFTIENPDLQMLNEIKENRQLIEDSYEANAKWLFSLSQEVKKPINEIETICNEAMDYKKVKELKEAILSISAINNNSKAIAANLLDVSSLDVNNIKIVNNKYDLVNLLEYTYKNAKNKVKENVAVNLNINSNIPNILYGDKVKLKQILNTVLENSIKYTDKGFIDINCSATTKYDACRLVITIEDSGCGMSLDKVNDLMKQSGDFTEDDNNMLNKNNLNIKIISKIIRLVGGHIMIKSEVGTGTKFTIILDQKIDNTSIKKENYDDYFNDKKVLIVSDKNEDIKIIKEYLNNNNISCITSYYGKDAISKIKNKENYDLILIESDMEHLSGYTTKKEVDKYKNIPSVIMTYDSNKSLKDAFIKDGFIDIIDKNNLKEELKRIIKNYL